MSIIAWMVFGLVAGALARFLVPGRDPMGLLGTMLLGLVGSFVGGFLVSLLVSRDEVGLVGSVIGAVIVLLVYRRVAAGRLS